MARKERTPEQLEATLAKAERKIARMEQHAGVVWEQLNSAVFFLEDYCETLTCEADYTFELDRARLRFNAALHGLSLLVRRTPERPAPEPRPEDAESPPPQGQAAARPPRPRR